MRAWTEIDLTDRTVLVTGATSGIGLETARLLAQRGANVILGCRNLAKGEAVAARLGPRASVLEVDLADLASVRRAAERVRADHPRLDLLVNNAGVMSLSRRETADGFEAQFGTNHLGHFALTGLIHDIVAARIVTVASHAHKTGRLDFDDLHWRTRRFTPRAYADSKLANLLFANELERRLRTTDRPTISLASHPGAVRSNLGHAQPGEWIAKFERFLRPVVNAFMTDPASGATPTIRACTDAGAKGGDYFGPRGPGAMRGQPVLIKQAARALDPSDARRLWEISEAATGVRFL